MTILPLEEAKQKGVVKDGCGLAQKDHLIACIAEAELWHDQDQVGYATISAKGHEENCRVRSRAFRNWISYRYFKQTGGAPSAQALEEALRVIEARCCFENAEHEAHLRVAEHNGNIYLDMADSDWRVIEVTPVGWAVCDRSPVKFIRPNGMRPIPSPVPGGNISDLRSFINVADDSGFVLILGWLIPALKPKGPYPILILNGEQGSAKSTLQRLLRGLIDPNGAPIRTAPSNEQDLMIAAKNGWVIALDNLSRVPPWLADALCRIATGGGFGARQLYTDADEVLFEAQRPIILNGIPDLATRPDLADRSIVELLPPIMDDERRTEEEFWADFESASGGILGSLLDALVVALRDKTAVHLSKSPRMADFARWAVAAMPGFGQTEKDFLEAYDGNRASAVDLTIEADPLAVAVRDFIVNKGEWSGTATDLLKIINGMVSDSVQMDRGWPKDATRLSGRLRRVQAALRCIGIEVSHFRAADGRRTRMIKLRNGGRSSVQSVQSVQDGLQPVKDAGYTLDAGSVSASRSNASKTKDLDATDATDADSQASSKWQVTI